MTQEDKQLLICDLCARLPYGVKVGFHKGYSPLTPFNYDIFTEQLSSREIIESGYNEYIFPIEYYRPYLRPMDSMNEEEREEYLGLMPLTNGWFVVMVWCNKHHFDYRGLIEKGLAIEVTEENNPYKNTD